MRISQIATATDVGQTRDNNEDLALRLDHVPLFAVADGMGGAEAGEVASRIAVDALASQAEEIATCAEEAMSVGTAAARLAVVRSLEDAFLLAHREVERVATERRAFGMGTTLVAVTLLGDRALVCHIGDSRAYLLRDDQLYPLTQDHSVAMLRFLRGQISEEELRTHPDQHRLYQAIGCGSEPDVSVSEVELADGDVLLLCSDGLSGPLTDAEIAQVLNRVEDLHSAAATLIQHANEKGGPDNVTVVLIEVSGDRDVENAELLTRTIRTNFLFRDLSEAELAVVAPYLEERVVPAGETFIQEGEPAEEFFVISEGSVRVSRGSTWLTDVGPGGHIGEIALARPTTRTASVKALTQLRLVALSRENFHQILARRPVLAARMSLALLDAVGLRLRELTERLNAVAQAAAGRY